MQRMSTAIVQALRIYPLKSAQGIRCERVRLEATGFEWDRHWMITRTDGTFLTQRTHPMLARIAVALDPHNLRLHSDGRPDLLLPLAAHGEPGTVRVWNDRCAGLDQGDAAAAWVSELLGEPVRVMRSPSAPARRADPRYAGSTIAPLAFPDGYPVLLCNQSSLEALNARLPEALPMERFRPNLVLSGLPPFAEDRIAAVQIGAVRLQLVKPCTRCVIPSQDQRTGLRGVDPLPVLRTFRFDPTLRGVTFGENALIATGVGATLELGSACEVLYEP